MIINKTMKTNFTFMAFAEGKSFDEITEYKHYIGVAPSKVIAINPDRKKLQQMYNRNIETEPEYIHTEQGIQMCRMDIYMNTDTNLCDIDLMYKITLFLRNEAKMNKDLTKVQVINEYGDTTWLNVEDYKSGNYPESQSWFDFSNIRTACPGEEELTQFIKTYLDIPNKTYRDRNTGTFVPIKNVNDAKARIDNFDKLFKGDKSIIQNEIDKRPGNRIKCIIGIKTDAKNRLWHDVFTKKFIRVSTRDYSYYQKTISNTQAQGLFPNTVFELCDLKEYKIEASDFSNNSPFDDDKYKVIDLPF